MDRTQFRIKAIVLFLTVFWLPFSSRADSNFFQVKKISFYSKEQTNGVGIWTPENKRKKTPEEFVPCLEAFLETRANTRSSDLMIKAYFFDAEKKQIGPPLQPAPSFHQKKTRANPFALPVIFHENQPENVFFRIPQSLLEKGVKWSTVVVFGDSSEATAKVFPDGLLLGYEFPERQLVSAAPPPRTLRTPVPEPVVEQLVHTRNPKHPKITLFLRFPNGIKETSEVKGVLAICMLANHVSEIRRKLEVKNPADYGGLFQFADQRNFAILCWGAQTLWRPDASYDELERETNKELDKGFDEVAAAWERGVGELHDKYGVPTRDFLLWGICASAQWAHRLVLRKPDHFLAAYIHIPSSFDKPTPDAAKVLWLLTSGELDGGYQHGVRWYADCRAAGYPIIYKAIMNLGHAGSPIADNLGLKFFDYALSLRDQRGEIDKKWTSAAMNTSLPKPWPEDFRTPAYVGDYLNQDVFPFDKRGIVPEALRVPLPTKPIAEAWNK